MQRTFVEVNGSRITLPAEVDAEEIKSRIRAAVREGGDLVDIPRDGGSPVSVLVTPVTAVVIRDEPIIDPAGLTADQEDVLADLEFAGWSAGNEDE